MNDPLPARDALREVQKTTNAACASRSAKLLLPALSGRTFTSKDAVRSAVLRTFAELVLQQPWAATHEFPPELAATVPAFDAVVQEVAGRGGSQSAAAEPVVGMWLSVPGGVNGVGGDPELAYPAVLIGPDQRANHWQIYLPDESATHQYHRDQIRGWLRYPPRRTCWQAPTVKSGGGAANGSAELSGAADGGAGPSGAAREQQRGAGSTAVEEQPAEWFQGIHRRWCFKGLQLRGPEPADGWQAVHDFCVGRPHGLRLDAALFQRLPGAMRIISGAAGPAAAGADGVVRARPVIVAEFHPEIAAAIPMAKGLLTRECGVSVHPEMPLPERRAEVAQRLDRRAEIAQRLDQRFDQQAEGGSAAAVLAAAQRRLAAAQAELAAAQERVAQQTGAASGSAPRGVKRRRGAAAPEGAGDA